VKAGGNSLIVSTEEPLRTRGEFLSPRKSSDYDWDALNDLVLEL